MLFKRSNTGRKEIERSSSQKHFSKKTNNILTEITVKQIEERFRELFKNMYSGVVIYEAINEGKDFIIKDVNISALKIANLAKENLIDKPLSSFNHLKNSELIKNIKEAWETGKTIHCPPFYFSEPWISAWLKYYCYKLPSGEVVAVFDDVSELIRFENSLKESEQRFKALAESTFEGIGFTENGKIIDVNDCLISMLGYEKDEIIGKDITDFIIPEFQSLALENMKTESEKVSEYLIINKAGIIFPVEARGKLLKINNRKIRIIAIRDITSRKESVRALIESEKKYRLLFENMNAGFVLHEVLLDINQEVSNFRYIDANETFSRQINRKIDDIIGKIIDDFDPVDFNTTKNFFLKAFNSGKPVKFETYSEKLKRHFSIMAYIPQKGQFAKIIEDVTERKKSEEELRKHSQAVKHSPVVVEITNVKGEIEYVNPRFSILTGYSEEEVIGKNPSIMKSGLQNKEFYKNLWDTVLAGKDWFGDFLNRKKNGELFWESASISPIFDSHGKITHFVAIKEDITEKKKIAEELKKAKENADLANRAKSDFIANMSHEIRTPMNAILGFAEILSEKVKEPEYKHFLNIILLSGKTLLYLLNDTLDISKIEADKLELHSEFMSLEEVLIELKQLFSGKIETKQLEFIIEISKDLPKLVLLDEIRIRQVLLNIISNAIKFTEKGFIKISVSNKLKFENSNKTDIMISIEDTGIGIAEDQTEKIFQPFEQVDGQSTRKYGGTGLGLAISSKLIKKMNGKISVKSKPGKGSIFIITLFDITFQNNSTFKNKKISENEMEIHFDPAKILIVDDVEIERILVKKFLEDYNFDILEAETGKEAIQKVKNENIDLIFLDIKMPEMDGNEAAKILKESDKSRKTPIIGLTVVTVQDLESGSPAYLDHHLLKPVNKSQIINTLKKYLPFQKIERRSNITAILPDSRLNIPDPDKLDEMLTRINKTLEEYEIINKTKEIKRIKHFAESLQNIAKEFNSGILEKYAQELTESVSSLQVVKTKTLLNDFPRLIEQLKQNN